MASANTVTAWFGFYEEGVMDALPSAHNSLEILWDLRPVLTNTLVSEGISDAAQLGLRVIT